MDLNARDERLRIGSEMGMNYAGMSYDGVLFAGFSGHAEPVESAVPSEPSFA
jgi:hypothetical protein